MRPGFNPARRNRNIGTASQGHGQDNRMVVPNPGRLISPIERIGAHVAAQWRVGSGEIRFVVEELRANWLHPCTIGDVIRLLERIPQSDWAGIRTIVFRQPSRKQSLLNPSWGRLFYFGEIVTARGRVVADGPMLLLDAIEQGHHFTWPTGLALDDQAELARLEADGHGVERSGNRYIIRVTPESARATQLYRTVPHEVGHWFDWLEKVETPAAQGEDFSMLRDRYFARPRGEREAFAHRYADGVHASLTATGAIPFEPQNWAAPD
ncbi:hypothetical protein HNP52_002262 [Sphingomonas kyeonggiensis]|uniref:Uncharacterized protein n=1 Tax=Sphingomonas kyeonggiensis TaxID=1268553 RepID=A0A7W7NRR7_9SPHN|nr:hypothetical protein [Sphingomonas kyeonggiensis]MBB4839193.1 hypothetical protein [Sphingomonas kyeonggiensis]